MFVPAITFMAQFSVIDGVVERVHSTKLKNSHFSHVFCLASKKLLVSRVFLFINLVAISFSLNHPSPLPAECAISKHIQPISITFKR
jgi:hypothetical protein